MREKFNMAMKMIDELQETSIQLREILAFIPIQRVKPKKEKEKSLKYRDSQRLLK